MNCFCVRPGGGPTKDETSNSKTAEPNFHFFCFLIFMIPCNCKLVSVFSQSLNRLYLRNWDSRLNSTLISSCLVSGRLYSRILCGYPYSSKYLPNLLSQLCFSPKYSDFCKHRTKNRAKNAFQNQFLFEVLSKKIYKNVWGIFSIDYFKNCIFLISMFLLIPLVSMTVKGLRKVLILE